MEHIVQFGITVDDEAIKQTIEKQALNQVCSQMRGDIMKAIGVSNNFEWKSKIGEITKDVVGDFFDINKDEIINLAADKLADKLWKTKQVKEKVAEVMNETFGG